MIPASSLHLAVTELFDGVEANVAIETQSPLTLGMTVIDWRGISGRPPNTRVMRTIDADRFYELLTERLAGLP
jgi:purine nucleosidase